MTNIAAMAKAGTVNVEQQIAFREAIENTKIDRSETCFQGFGYLSVDELVQFMEYVDEMCDETPW